MKKQSKKSQQKKEVVEVDLPEEKTSGKIADLATPEETDQEAEEAIEDVSEEPQQKSEDELEDYSEKVKKRINTLTRKLREAERGQESAYEYAKRIAEENQVLKSRSTSLDKSYLNEAESRLKSQKAQALAALKMHMKLQIMIRLQKLKKFLQRQPQKRIKYLNLRLLLSNKKNNKLTIKITILIKPLKIKPNKLLFQSQLEEIKNGLKITNGLVRTK